MLLFDKHISLFITLYYHGKPFALLLPITSLGEQKRVRMYIEHGIQVLVPHARNDFTGGGNVHYHTAWFCWKLLPPPPTPSFLHFYELVKTE